VGECRDRAFLVPSPSGRAREGPIIVSPLPPLEIQPKTFIFAACYEIKKE